MLDFRLLYKNYAYPAVFAAVAAGFSWLQTNKPELFGFLDSIGVTPTMAMAIISAAVAYFMTRFNPKAGKDEPWMTPKDVVVELPRLGKK